MIFFSPENYTLTLFIEEHVQKILSGGLGLNLGENDHPVA